MKQVILSSRTYNQGPSSLGLVQPVYAALRGGGLGVAWSGDGTLPDVLTQRTHPWSVAGTFRNFYVQMSAPSQNSASIYWSDTPFTLYINGVATALTVTVPAAGPQAGNGFTSASSNVIDAVTIAPGDTVYIVRTHGTVHGILNGLSAPMMWSLTFDSDEDGESGYGSAMIGTVLNNTNTYCCAPFNGAGTAFAFVSEAITATTAHSIVPTAGSIFRCDVLLQTAPGLGNTHKFVFAVNDVVQDGSGGTVDTRFQVTGTATTGFGTFDLPLVALDRVTLKKVPGTGTASSRIAMSIGFRATVDGESCLCFNGANANPTVTGATDIIGSENTGWSLGTPNAPVPPIPPASRWPYDEDQMWLAGGIDPFTLSGFCVNLSASPGGGKSLLFTTRKEGVDTDMTLTLTGASGDASVLAQDNMGTDDYLLVSDTLDMSVVGSGTPASPRVSWSWLMVAEVTPPPPTVTSYPIRRLRRFALPFNGNLWQKISRFELILQAGVGLSGTAATVQGYDPLVMFRLSRDGGQTWDNELTMNMGKIGEYERRAFLLMLGRARNPVVEISSSDPVFVAWLSCTIDVEQGTS